MKKTNSCIVLCPLVLLAWTILSDAGDPCEGNECSTGLDEGVEELRIDESLNEYDQEDERLIEILKNEYLVSPDSKKSIFLSQKPSSKSLGGQFGQPYEIDDMYK